MSSGEDSDDASLGDAHCLSRNPIIGLGLLTDAGSLKETVEKVSSLGDLQATGLVLGVIEDLAFEADRLGAQFRQSVPSLASGALDEYLRAPEHFNNRKIRGVRAPNLGRLLSDDRVQNLSNLLDVQQEPPPIARAEHRGIREQLEGLVAYLENESPASERTIANILAVELKRGPIALLELGEYVDHCFVTPSVASKTTGSLTSHALRWSASGSQDLAQKVFLLAVAVTGLFFTPSGALGVAIAANDLRKALPEPKEP